RVERLEALAGELAGVEVLSADLGRRDGQDAVAARIADADRPIDLVVNNAGFGTSGAFHESDPDRLDEEVGLNVAALTRLSHAALATMVPRRRGWLLNVASVAAFQPGPHLAVYAATKAYVLSLSESLHEEVKRDGVTVTALCPGLIRTEFQDVSNTEHYQSSFPGFVWCDVADVVRDALAATAKGRAVIVPGALYKTVTWLGGVTPRWAKRVASGVIPRE
ncbi:MAG: SDR family NAD(P)-dependent oxidoreductase, partial [Ilumatobacteraceae bacterium]